MQKFCKGGKGKLGVILKQGGAATSRSGGPGGALEDNVVPHITYNKI